MKESVLSLRRCCNSCFPHNAAWIYRGKKKTKKLEKPHACGYQKHQSYKEKCIIFTELILQFIILFASDDTVCKYPREKATICRKARKAAAFQCSFKAVLLHQNQFSSQWFYYIYIAVIKKGTNNFLTIQRLIEANQFSHMCKNLSWTSFYPPPIHVSSTVTSLWRPLYWIQESSCALFVGTDGSSGLAYKLKAWRATASNHLILPFCVLQQSVSCNHIGQLQIKHLWAKINISRRPN